MLWYVVLVSLFWFYGLLGIPVWVCVLIVSYPMSLFVSSTPPSPSLSVIHMHTPWPFMYVITLLTLSIHMHTYIHVYAHTNTPLIHTWQLFRADLISAMKLPDSTPMESGSFLTIKEPWRTEWEIGVQVNALH